MKKSYSFLLFSLIISTAAVAQVDYATEIQTIFNASCTSCHGGQSGVTLTSYSATINSVGAQYGTNIVVAGNASTSPLVDKIEPTPQFGGRMPQGGSLSQDQIDKIKAWINEGANEIATSNEEEVELAKEFRLVGNYPNPFNPSTTVQFEAPVSVQYTLSIFTVNGQLVKEQVGTASPGIVKVAVDFFNQPSGMYIYQLRTLASGRELFSDTGIMTLVK